ncbi:type I secretion system permease/ATPase [Chelativorans sp. AA-79]|uniref:type I secretion system permease/ATPase n=1 Tax=Chelativorans sp. AA-79 TaxID=3028735 RepID=UPI0023FA44C6|nr:type I secretion system permease/ATPase [Chelativorans sp. AA-79]WEX08261.1 type I secretion system permease/ATPase [Chelativorans sp. AA-79]
MNLGRNRNWFKAQQSDAADGPRPGEAQAIEAAPRAAGRARVTPHATADEIPEALAGADLLDGLLLLCRLHNRPATSGELTSGLPLEQGRLTIGLLSRAAARADLDVRVRRRPLSSIPPHLLPALVLLSDGSAVALVSREGEFCRICHPELDSREETVSLAALSARHSGLVVLAAPLVRSDDRAGPYAAEPEQHWFWSEIKRYRWDFAEVGFAAALANTLAVVTSLFSMQVYDRVVPNLAFATLWVLALGVLIAIGIEAVVRITRAYLMDAAGRRIDQRLSARIFEQALGLRLEARPAAVGSFASQVREFDGVREFFTSTTIGTLSDIPFTLLFMTVIWLIGGPVVWVLIAAIPFIVLPGIVAQWPLSRMSRQHLREGAIRNGLLIEALSSAETVKSLQGEARFQRLWEEYTQLLSGNGMQTRRLSSVLNQSARSVQQIAYVMVMVVGVYEIAAGNMTTGGLLACAILSGRTIGPLTRLSSIFARWQQMRVALRGLDGIMKTPVDRPVGRRFVHRPRLKGAYDFEALSFRYDQDGGPILQIPSFSVAAGSATALLGTNGSGKSTLLKLLSGLHQPAEGRVLLDGTEMRQIDPVDVRRAVGYLPQDVRLFYGTVRENLLMGLENREDEELLEALRFTGADSLVRDHPLGLDRKLGEGGSGMSGGQRQSLGLARLWLRDPRIVLLDEPTAAMDHTLEMRVIENLRGWLAGRTLVVATHRQPILSLVQRAVVMKNGRPVADGPVEGVLAALSSSEPARKA